MSRSKHVRKKPAQPAWVGLWLTCAGVCAFGVGFDHAVRGQPATPRALANRVAGILPTPAPVRQKAPAPVAIRPAPATPSGRLAIVIDDCGNSYAANQGFLEFPQPLTLAVLPHLPATHRVAQEARQHGRCVILHLPMETLDGRNPGPGTLKVGMDAAALESTLTGDLDDVAGIVGVNNHEGSRASADERVMGAVLDEVSKRGLFYLDSRTTPHTVAPRLAAAHGVACLSRQVFLDNLDDSQAVLAQLHLAQQRARQGGEAIAIGHPRPNTLTALRRYAAEDHGGVELVTLQELLSPAATRPGRSHV